MPWDLYIKHKRKNRSLGPVEEVQSRLHEALPTIEFYKEVSGAEKLKLMEDQGIELPDVLKNNFLVSKGSHMGIYEDDGFSIEFCLGQDPDVNGIVVEVRGNRDPMGAIDELLCVNEWDIRDADARVPRKESWDKFTKWRDEAVESSKDLDDA